jgi:ABC-type Fe3+-hydroxamate transport system substrate-binding protein
MHRHITTAALAAAALLALTACSSSDDATAASSSTPSSVTSSIEAAAGLPAAPDAATRVAILAALKTIDPSLVTDEDKAVDSARNQCSTITGGGNATASAQARFSTSDHQVTEAEAQAINTTLKALLCTKS